MTVLRWSISSAPCLDSQVVRSFRVKEEKLGNLYKEKSSFKLDAKHSGTYPGTTNRQSMA